MKPLSKKTIFNGPVNGEHQVTFGLSNEGAEELRGALSIVQRYEKAAKKALGVTKNTHPDWVMFGYSVKNDKVVITVEEGACG